MYDLTDEGAAAMQKMEESIRHDVKEIFFALWAEREGIDWKGLSQKDRDSILARLGWAWHRAIPRPSY